MDVKITQIPEDQPEQALLYCHRVDERVRDIARFIHTRSKSLLATADEKQYAVNISRIFYAESVDHRLYLYTSSQVYEYKGTLAALEEELAGHGFVRISRNVLVNLMKIEALQAGLNGRLMAILQNEEKVIISRKYVPELRRRLKGGSADV